MKDARTFRTLALLDLESHPPPAGIDAVTLRVDPTPAPTLQHSLLERARPAPEQMSTLVARLTALMGERRVGRPVLLDTYRPGAFEMAGFTGSAVVGPNVRLREAAATVVGPNFSSANSANPANGAGPALRRFRQPVGVVVAAEGGRPARVRLARRDVPGGRVEASAGPWRTAGEWWTQSAWDHDEWDVALDDGTLCRLMRDRRNDRWYLEGVYD